MPLFEYQIDELSLVGSGFIEEVNDELKRALAAEKGERKITQQSIADTLGVDRSVVNRRFMGLENLTARTIAETLWAIGWEPHFEARKITPEVGANMPTRQPTIAISTGSTSTTLSGSGSQMSFKVRAA